MVGQAPFLVIISCIRLINPYAVAFVLGIRGCNHTVSLSCLWRHNVIVTQSMLYLHWSNRNKVRVVFVLDLILCPNEEMERKQLTSEVVGPSLYIGCSGMNDPNYTASK